MTKVFVSGSRSVRTLPAAAKTSLDKIMGLGFIVFVGDCHGVDTLVQDYLAEKDYRRVVVFHIGEGPRNNRGFDTVQVSGSTQTDKDAAMSKGAEYGLAIWDGHSPGTAKNIARVARTKVVRAEVRP
jgi:adenine-specific DNA-methyltransferase